MHACNLPLYLPLYLPACMLYLHEALGGEDLRRLLALCQVDLPEGRRRAKVGKVGDGEKRSAKAGGRGRLREIAHLGLLIALRVEDEGAVAALGLGLRLWRVGAALGALGHFAAVWAARRDPMFVDVTRRHLRISSHLSV